MRAVARNQYLPIGCARALSIAAMIHRVSPITQTCVGVGRAE